MHKEPEQHELQAQSGERAETVYFIWMPVWVARQRH